MYGNNISNECSCLKINFLFGLFNMSIVLHCVNKFKELTLHFHDSCKTGFMTNVGLSSLVTLRRLTSKINWNENDKRHSLFLFIRFASIILLDLLLSLGVFYPYNNNV